MNNIIDNISDDANKQSWDITYLLSMAENALESGDIEHAMSLALGGMKLAKSSNAQYYQKEFRDIIGKIEENEGRNNTNNTKTPSYNSQKSKKLELDGEKKISTEKLNQILRLNKNLENKETHENLETKANKDPSEFKSFLKNMNNPLKINSKKSPSNVKKTIHNMKSQISNKIKNSFLEQKYFLINSLQNIQGIDFLALKTIEITKHKFLVLLIPIKWCQNTREHIIIEEYNVRFAHHISENQSKLSKIMHQDLILLRQSQIEIIREIAEQQTLYDIIKRFLKENFTMETFQNNQCVYFHNGLREYKVITSPIYISTQKIGFLEKVLPYPYQRSSNIHFAELDKLSLLLSFIEQKYAAITEYSEEENTIQHQSEQYNNYLDRIQKCSIPFIPVSLLLLILSIFFAGDSFMILLGSGIFFLVLYGILFAFFTIMYLKTISKIKNELQNSTNMNSRPPLLDETDLELIAQYFPEQEMEQFIYECFGKDYEFGTTTFHYNNNYITPKEDLERPQERTDKAENNKKEALSKYIQLLED